jgi:Protein of unknown function (DUF2380)
MSRFAIALALGLAAAGLARVWLPFPAQAAPSQCIAAFDFELIDLSLEGQVNGASAAEGMRLQQISGQLRDWLTQQGYRPCDLSPVAADVEAVHLYGCGCVQKLAQRLDASLAITGIVQKVSNLILNVEVEVTEVETGKPVMRANTQFRSNTDESWRFGTNWLIKNRLSQALAFLLRGKP